MTEKMICKAIQSRLSDQGLDWVQMESLTVDRDGKRINAVLDLEGETETVDLGAEYELAESSIRIVDVEASRRWMTGFLSIVLAAKGAEFPLPDGMQGSMIKMVL